MDCPYCQTMNPAQARFCLGCGRSLVQGLVCSSCHTLLPDHARYCFHCGALVIAAARGATEAAGRPAASTADAGGRAATPTPATPPPSPTVAPVAEATVAVLGQLPPARPLGTMLTSLQRYLPQALYEPLERRPREDDVRQARDHMAALLTTAKTYLPYPVVLAPQPAGQPAGSLCQGTFLFVDVSGFTPLSERLSALGKAGAERITDIINDLFGDLVSCLFQHGGTLVKFGGDALLGLFAAASVQEMSASALRAVQAAAAMQAQMDRFAAIEAAGETRALRIKCGISSGRYFAAHIGTHQSMAYVTIGHTVNQADQAEGHARPGDVVLAPSTHNLLAGQVEVKEGQEGFVLLHHVPPLEAGAGRPALAEPPDGDVDRQIAYLVDRLDRLAPYLPPDLLARIVTNPSRVHIVPEHRLVTVMFANYVGISDLIDDMGDSHPELITQHLNAYFVHMAGVVERYEGTLGRMDQYSVGDRLVIFFGAPRAHEDDPARAVYCALDMQAATRRHFAALQAPDGIYRFRQRVGINTGYLFAGNVGAPDLRQEYTLMGDNINMAARLMSMAGWNDILVSDRTQAHVTAFFELEDRGQLKVKGKEIRIPTYQVLGRRQEIGRTRGLGSSDAVLVNRSDEVSRLQGCGQQLLNGRGQIVAIAGDSGLGKSRLMRELKGWLFGQEDAAGVNWLEGHALSFSERMSYWLAAQVLRGVLGAGSEASQDDVLFGLWEQGEALMGKEMAREAIPFLAHLLDLPLQGEWQRWVAELEPQVRQKQTFWAARQFFAALAHQRPLVIALDDLHWADEASLALIEDLLSVTDQAPLMFCLVFRQRRDKGCWRLNDTAASKYPHRYTRVALEPLTEACSRQLLQELVPGATFQPEVEREILTKTTGNPFYLEEVVRALIAQGVLVRDPDRPEQWSVASTVDEIAVPDTLQGAVLARIDRLTEDARQALEIAAVIGRRFQRQVLAGLVEAEATLETWLAQLERSDLIRQAELDPQPVYAFPDALVQEVAYESLLVQRRQEFHRRIGEALETILAGRLEQECELLAHHFGHSDDAQKARHYLDMAAAKAQREFANETAIEHNSQLLALLGEAEATWEQRFDVLARRQQVYGLVGRPGDRQADLETMLALARAHDDDARRADALNELADLSLWTGQYPAAEEAARQALALKTEQGDATGRATALHHLGVLDYYRGNYQAARPSLEEAVRLRQETGDTGAGAWSLMYLGMIHFFQGDYGQAAEHHRQALEVAQARQDWFQEGIHLTNAARVNLRLGEYEQARQQFERSLEMKRRVGDRTGQGFSLYYLGLSDVYLERYDQAQEALDASLALRKQIQDERGVGYSLHGLGLVALGRGQGAEAEALFRQAYEQHRELGLKAEAVVSLSFLGQALLARGDAAAAAAASQQALELLAEQKAVEELQQVHWNHYRVMAALGDEDAARQALAAARDAVLEQAARIGDPEKREAFLHRVTVNRQILEAAG
ncbi:MAG: adenylate/guanylate cyclase domain-containing protein [Anaerolineae bacterium]